jgi:hypothetical protein
MGQPEKYRQYAAESLHLASDFREPGARAVLHHMAQVWLRLAQDAEGRDQSRHDQVGKLG